MFSVCKICNEKIEKSGWTLARSLFKHVRENHHISNEEYVITYIHDGQRPVCGCGCGNFTVFNKSKYRRFYKNHFNDSYVKNNDEYLDTKKIHLKRGLEKKVKEHYENIDLTIPELKKLFNQFKKPMYNQTEISSISKHDFRTIKNWWIRFGIAGASTIDQYSRMHQHAAPKDGENNPQYQRIDNKILKAIRAHILYMNSEKKVLFTYSKIIRIFELDCSSIVLKRRLSENFGEEFIDEYFSKGIKSEMEFNFFTLLSYFFTDKISRQFDLGGKRYDFIIGTNVLVEFDGAYWHGHLEHKPPRAEAVIRSDKEKTELAKKWAIVYLELLILSQKIQKKFLN